MPAALLNVRQLPPGLQGSRCASPVTSCDNALDRRSTTSSTSSNKSRAKPITQPANTSFEVIDGRCVWKWQDTESDALGWIVIDASQPALSGGGLFLHKDASYEEVRDVAMAMSTKLAVSSQPQVVGAKGGIRFCHRHPEASEVLERFIRDHALIISKYWATGGDLNTSHVLIDGCAKKHCISGTQSALDALRVGLMCPTPAADVPLMLQETIPATLRLCSEWSVEEYSVGYVAATTLKQLLERIDPQLIGKARFILQGFGTVGSTFAHAVSELRLGIIVGISSQYGFLVDDEGIDCLAIERARRKMMRVGSADVDPASLEAGLWLANLETGCYTSRDKALSEEHYLSTFLTACRGNVFVPCAGRYVLTPLVISSLREQTFADDANNARLILAGANNVVHQSLGIDAALRLLDDAHIIMLPEWTTNSGTSNLFMRACSGLARRGAARANLEACAADTATFLKRVLDKINVANATSSMLWQVCLNIADERRKQGAANLLGVMRVSHFDLISSNARRAEETLQYVGNAKPSDDGQCFLLPHPDDPTINVRQADPGADHSEVGISVRFSVFNLSKTKAVLQSHRIKFAECRGGDGKVELHLDGESVGYPMSFRQSDTSDRRHVMSPQRVPAANLIPDVKGLDHYTLIVPNAAAVRDFHERMLGFRHLRTITLNAGSAPAGRQDMLNHVMGLPYDDRRVLVITEGLVPESIFSQLLQRKRRPFVHHFALEVGDVEAAFQNVRAAGWGTTSEQISADMLSGLRQFFLKEEEAGCFIELIERSDGRDTANGSSQSTRKGKWREDLVTVESAPVDGVNRFDDESSDVRGQGQFRKCNMASLAQSMMSYVSK